MVEIDNIASDQIIFWLINNDITHTSLPLLRTIFFSFSEYLNQIKNVLNHQESFYHYFFYYARILKHI